MVANTGQESTTDYLKTQENKLSQSQWTESINNKKQKRYL